MIFSKEKKSLEKKILDLPDGNERKTGSFI